MDGTHGQTRRAWHAIIAFGLADTVGQHRASHAIIAFGLADTVGRHRASHAFIAFGLANGRATSGVACHLRPWAAQTVRRRRAWHAIIALGQHRRSAVVGRDMPSPPLDSTNGQTTSGVASHYRHWTSSHSQTASGVACHHRPWTANTVERRRAWHAIIALGQNTRSDGVGHGMPSSPLDSTDGRPSSGVACHHSPWTAHTVGQSRAWHAIIAFG